VVSPNPGQTAGAAIDTRRPTVVSTKPGMQGGIPAWDTAQGTVFLVLGGGGTNGPANVYGTDTATDLPQAKVISGRNAITRARSWPAAGLAKRLPLGGPGPSDVVSYP
jgi:hypothetical protein